MPSLLSCSGALAKDHHNDRRATCQQISVHVPLKETDIASIAIPTQIEVTHFVT